VIHLAYNVRTADVAAFRVDRRPLVPAGCPGRL